MSKYSACSFDGTLILFSFVLSFILQTLLNEARKCQNVQVQRASIVIQRVRNIIYIQKAQRGEKTFRLFCLCTEKSAGK